MKILVINYSPFIGSGSGTYTMNVARALKNKDKFEREKLSKYAKDNYSQDAVINNLIKTFDSVLNN